MSQGGVFRLVVRDDRFDKFFTASDYLRARINQIRQARYKRGEKNITPTFTDIQKTHILYVRAVYHPFVAIACEYIRVEHSGGGGANIGMTGGGAAEFTFPIYGHFTSDMVVRVRFADVGTQNPTAASPRFRFCAFPGIRLFQKVEFSSSGTPVDDYVADEASFFNKFHVPPGRRPGWERGLGQQELRWAEFFNANGFTGCMPYKEGLQTLNFFHPSRDLWVPLHFWFCKDPANALLNDLIPNTQRKVTIIFPPLTDILRAFDQVTGQQVTLPLSQLGLTLELYVNNLFVNPEIHEIFATRIGFSLIRVHRRQIRKLNTAFEQIKLDKLKYPAEFLHLGIRDLQNATNFDHWHLYGRARVRGNTTALLTPAAQWNTVLNICELVCRTGTEVTTLDRITDSIKLTAHGIDLYPELPTSFFSDYLPQRYYAGTEVVPPTDIAAMIVNFCLFPGKADPSGYYNLSAGRELFLTHNSPTISAQTPAELVVTMSALNFLIRKGDVFFARYSM